MADITFSSPVLERDITVHGVAGDMHTLLAIAKKNHVPIPFDCQDGDCGSCLVKVTVVGGKEPLGAALTEKEKYTLAAHGDLTKADMDQAELKDIPPQYRLACQYIVLDQPILVEFSGEPGVAIESHHAKPPLASVKDIETTGAEDRQYKESVSN